MRRDDISSIVADNVIQYSNSFPAIVVLSTIDGRKFEFREMDKNNLYIKDMLLNCYNNSKQAWLRLTQIAPDLVKAARKMNAMSKVSELQNNGYGQTSQAGE